MTPQEYVQNVLITESNTFLKAGFLPKLAYKVFNYLNPNSLAARLSNPRSIRLLHGGLGLCTEIAELFENLEKDSTDMINLKEEVADALWYQGIMIDELKFDPNILIQKSSLISTGSTKEKLNHHIDVAVKHTGLLQDLLKKHIFYGKPLAIEKVEAEMIAISREIASMSELGGFTVEESMIANIEKLRARYGQKFSEHRAIHRDLKTERQILEK